MVDFLMVSTRSSKRGVIEIYPKFIINNRSSDLMIRGGDFYAVWLENIGLWSTDEQDALDLIDRELDIFAAENASKYDANVKVLHMWDSDNGMIDKWIKYCKKQSRDNFHMLDEKLIFSNTPTNKKDYASKKLPYPLEKCETPFYDRLMSVLYSPEEREKIEWAIGSIVAGDSKKNQKFLVLYGAAGTGKSTVLNIIQQLFDGYYSTFDAKALGSASNSFALEAFKTNPLVAIQHDGDLSRIEDNTRLNSVVSHELMTVNEKFKSQYTNKFKTFLFMGTNKPVRITDAKSGLMRRLIDVSPTGDKIPPREYKAIMNNIGFELGGIAEHCRELYLANADKYDNYIPVNMMGASNDFYNFILDSYYVFKRDDATTLKSAWEMYKTYCEDANVSYPMSRRVFQEELKNYFKNFEERAVSDDGARVRSFYSGFKSSIFQITKKKEEPKLYSISLTAKKSIFDKEFADCPAQYANEEDKPTTKWVNVTTKLSDLDTTRVHYVKPPSNLVVIDFDIPDENGEKSKERNLEEASKWPPTYTELSKSGKGVHLHYIYLGDVSKLQKEYSDHIEIKVFRGNSSLRRCVTKCNGLPIATISSGLPLKGDVETVINTDQIKSEKWLRNFVKKCLNKEHHGATKPEMDFIKAKLDQAYESGITYDISDMKPAILAFAAGSSHQASTCIKLVRTLKLKSKDVEEQEMDVSSDNPLVVYDVEVFPNLFLVNWKRLNEDMPVQRMINPSKEEIEQLVDNSRLIGFNCKRYDNHILYGRMMGYDNEQLFLLSQKIIGGSKDAFFSRAYDLSYTDIYDFSSEKKSLKKFEIELGIHHQELGLPWDQPVPENMWPKVAEYCDNDVIATEAVFNARQGDFQAREILADLAGSNVNDSTNSLTAKIIFGSDRAPQSQFNYRNLGEPVITDNIGLFYPESYLKFTAWNGQKSAEPFFPGYIFENGVSMYRGEEVGEGGYVYAEPGMYGNVALLDAESMHPSSATNEDLFGRVYTQKYKELLDIRLAIKHRDFNTARTMMGGKISKYLTDENTADALSKALKIAINSVYGLTSANFPNPFKDPRNLDNIVAKRGALFMIDLKNEVQKRGFTVAHIKTDSIKIPDATPEIISFVVEFGKKYGYNFVHEATYDRMCLVNNAVYIARYDNGKWTATGTQFQVPYVFKKLFSHDEIIFDDMCETKSVSGTSNIYLDMNEKLPEGEHDYRFVGRVGRFCPIRSGKNGGELFREKDGKYYAVAGTKGYRWLESEYVDTMGMYDCIDTEYYEKLVDEARKAIDIYANCPHIPYGDFRWFVSDEPYVGPEFVDGKPLYLSEIKF